MPPRVERRYLSYDNTPLVMRLHLGIITAVAGLLFGHGARAQAAREQGPIGVWRGTSTCTVRPSPCHDEVVVYRIARSPTSDSLSFDARKIVNGQEEEMGVLACTEGARGARVTCPIRNGTWHFAIRGDSLVGELRLTDDTKFRDIRTSRSR